MELNHIRAWDGMELTGFIGLLLLIHIHSFFFFFSSHGGMYSGQLERISCRIP